MNSVVSPKLLAFFFFGSLGVAFLLIPKDSELYGRFMADGHEKQAMEVLGEGQAPAGLIEQHLGQMATNTLGEGDPKRSAELCDELIASGEELDEQILRTMMLAYRYTNRPADSLIAANKLAAIEEKRTGEMDEELAMERAQTHMALSQPGDAFDIYKNLFEKTRNSSNVNKLMPLLIQSASFSGKADQLRPIYEHILSESPETKMSIAELVASRGPENADQHAKFMRSAGQFAQMCEWSDAYDTAFDYYLKLAALGDTTILPRLKDLNAGLFRDNEFGEVLESLVPIEGQDEYTLILATILGEDGQYEKSLQHFTQYSEKYPNEVDVVIQMGGLYEETGEMSKALAMYEKALEGRPSDPSILLRMAEIYVAEGNYQKALESYKAFPETKHSEETVEEYAMLASALGDYDSYRNAMQITFTTTKNPTLEHYLDLAESHHLLGDSEAEMTVLNGAVHAFEGSPRAAVALAEAFYREGAHLEAAERLATLNLGENMQAASLFIEICNGTDDYQLAVKNLPDAIEERFDFTPSLRIALAQIYEGTGRNTQADRLYASVPSGNPAWQLVALSRYRMGDYDRAELYQKRFLRGAEMAGADDWTLMGDIYKTQGKDELATQAYEKSYILMKSRIAPVTDSSS